MINFLVEINVTRPASHSEHRLSSTFLQRFSYATEGVLFISARLSTNAVSVPPKSSGTDKTVETTYRPSTHVNMRRVHPRLKKKKKKKEFRHDWGFICAGVNFVGGCK